MHILSPRILICGWMLAALLLAAGETATGQPTAAPPATAPAPAGEIQFTVEELRGAVSSALETGLEDETVEGLPALRKATSLSPDERDSAWIERLAEGVSYAPAEDRVTWTITAPASQLEAARARQDALIEAMEEALQLVGVSEGQFDRIMANLDIRWVRGEAPPTLKPRGPSEPSPKVAPPVVKSSCCCPPPPTCCLPPPPCCPPRLGCCGRLRALCGCAAPARCGSVAPACYCSTSTPKERNTTTARSIVHTTTRSHSQQLATHTLPQPATVTPGTLSPQLLEGLLNTHASLVIAERERPTSSIVRTVSHTSTASTPQRSPLLATHVYGTAFHLYWSGQYRAALAELETALQYDEGDARIWYYKGLSEYALRDLENARRSIAVAIGLHSRSSRGQASAIGKALERVQGHQRAFLEELVLKAQLLRTRPRSRESFVATSPIRAGGLY